MKADILDEGHENTQDCYDQVRTRGGSGLGQRLRKLFRRKESSARRGPPTESLRIVRTRRDDQRGSGSRRERPEFETTNYYTDNTYSDDIEDIILRAVEASEASRRQVSRSPSPHRQRQERHRSRPHSSQGPSPSAREEYIFEMPEEESPPPYAYEEDFAGEDVVAGMPTGKDNRAESPESVRRAANRSPSLWEELPPEDTAMPTEVFGDPEEEQLFAQILEEERSLDPVLVDDQLGR